MSETFIPRKDTSLESTIAILRGKLDEARRYDDSLSLLFSEGALRQAQALIRRKQQFFGLNLLGPTWKAATCTSDCWVRINKCSAWTR